MQTVRQRGAVYRTAGPACDACQEWADVVEITGASRASIGKSKRGDARA